MNSRSPSLLQRRQSSTASIRTLTRRFSARSLSESGHYDASFSADAAIEEEIEEIKRYEV